MEVFLSDKHLFQIGSLSECNLAALGHARAVKRPEKPTAHLLDHAVDVMFRIYLMRGDCSAAARALLSQPNIDEAALEDCARLDDALAEAYRDLQNAIRNIQRARARRGRTAR